MVKTKQKCRPSADPTRAKILKSALKLFVKNGYAATSINDIAVHAKINQSLIYHHFQDKKALWKYVKAHLLENYSVFNEVTAFEELAEGDFKSFLRGILQLRFNFYDNNPEAVRMLNWQRLEYDKKELQSTCYASQEKWLEVIESYKKQGEIRADIPTEIAINLIWSAVSGLFMDHFPTFSTADQKLKQAYLNAMIDCLSRALTSEQ